MNPIRSLRATRCAVGISLLRTVMLACSIAWCWRKRCAGERKLMECVLSTWAAGLAAARQSFECLTNHIDRLVLRLVIGAHDHFSHQAHANHLHAQDDEEGRQKKQRPVADVLAYAQLDYRQILSVMLALSPLVQPLPAEDVQLLGG